MKRVAVVPDVALAAAFLVAWLVAGGLGPATVSALVVMIELEAIAILAAFCVMALLVILTTDAGLRPKLAAVAIALMGVTWVLSEGLRQGFWWPALIVAGLIANRVAGLVTGELRGEHAKMQLFVEALWGFGIYIAVVGASLALGVPAVGSVPPLPAEHARWCALPGRMAADVLETRFRADWCAEPHRALAAGGLYYLVAVWRGLRRRPYRNNTS